ncbi:unnamed protein product, partial [Meganyctiphanes norvegica]
MAPKKDKKKKSCRNKINFETKVKIIEMKDSGATLAEIYKEFQFPKSTLCTIYSQEGRDIVQKAKDECLSPKALVMNTFNRPPVVDAMEDILFEWINMNLNRKIPLSESIVRVKALDIFNYLMDSNRSIFSKDGTRITKGVTVSRVQMCEALGPAYEEDPDDPQSENEDTFEGFTPRDTVGEYYYSHTGVETIQIHTDFDSESETVSLHSACDTQEETISETIPIQSACGTQGETIPMQIACGTQGETIPMQSACGTQGETISETSSKIK